MTTNEIKEELTDRSDHLKVLKCEFTDNFWFKRVPYVYLGIVPVTFFAFFFQKLDDKLQQTKTQVIDWKDGLKDEYERAWVNFAKKRNKK